MYYVDFYIKRETEKSAGQQPSVTTMILLSGVHHVLRSEGHRDIGVAFPKWVVPSESGKIPEIGNVVRVIGPDEQVLFQLRGNPWFTCQILAGDVAVSKVLAVPQDAGHICYVRNREAEMAKQELERLTGKPVNVLDINRLSDDPAARLRIMTIAKPVNMLIKRVPIAERIEGCFNSYGLCSKENMASVPDF